MKFDPAVFGEGFHSFVQAEYGLLGLLSPVFHILSYLLLIAVFTTGNRFRKVFTVYFAAHWIFLFGYWGVYGAVYWLGIGPVYLAVYGITPVLLGLISFNLIKEIRKGELNFDLRSSSGYRFVVFCIAAWGLWYPTYIYGSGFSFQLRDLLFSYYGLMPCPSTMLLLGLMTVSFPDTNRVLFRLMTVYALFIGTATVLSGWLPDIPFIALGLYALILDIKTGRSPIPNRR